MINTFTVGVLSLAVSQINPTVGDINGNIEKISTEAQYARDVLKTDLIIFPELCISGYPPKELLSDNCFYEKIDLALEKLTNIHDIYVIIGIPKNNQNQALVLYNGETKAVYAKQTLNSNFNFIEKNYFNAGDKVTIFSYNNVNIGLLIGDDVCNESIIACYAENNVDLLISLNAPVYHTSAINFLVQESKIISKKLSIPIISACLVGGQDELILTGGSFAIDAKGTLRAQLQYLQETTKVINFSNKELTGMIAKNHNLHSTAMIYECLVTSLRDYVHKNGFKKAILGISGGIDSAVSAAIAVDALGKENVIGAMMPFKYTSELSIILAEELATNLGIQLHNFAIYGIYNAVSSELSESIDFTPKNTTDENLQARSRSILLMTLANHTNSLVLATGNKSEIATGYFTLYGDSAGSFSVLSDVLKTQVYQLAKYINKKNNIIPKNTITRKPTAELASEQLDQDYLPSYSILDSIITMYLSNCSVKDIEANINLDKDKIRWVLNIIIKNAFKRYQVSVGPQITMATFSNKHKHSITNSWHY